MKQKLTLLILALVTSMGAWATTDITFSSDEIKKDGTNPATYYNGSGSVVNDIAWCRSFVTNTSIPITFTVGSLDRFSNFSGGFNTNGNLWITATVPSQYSITNVSFKAKIIDGGSKEVYVEGNSAGTVALTSEYQLVSSAALNSSSVRFRFQNGNDGSNVDECIVVFEDFTFTIDTELVDAAASISNNHIYRVITYNNGTEEGSTKYYLTATGTLTDQLASAGEFTFTTTTSNYAVPAGYAWRITADNGTTYFTNPTEGSRDNYIHYTTKDKRENWEAQVFFLNSGGKCAVRATNTATGSGYDCNAFWTVKVDANSDGIPEADYASELDERHYVWQLEEVASVTYNLIFQGDIIRTKVVSRASVIGTAALPDASWNHACCEYSYSPSTITGETETVNVTMTWNVGDLTFSSDYASATWYHMSLHSKWAKYDESINGSEGHPLYADKNEVNYDVSGFAGMWAFVGNPLDGVYILNREAGDGKVLGWTTPPRMQGISEGSSKKFTIGKQSDTEFILYYSGYYINDFSNNGKLAFWNNAAGATASGSAITVEDISLYELSLMELEEYAREHAEGEYFGLKSSAVTSLGDAIKAAKASFNSAAASDAHDAIQALWPGTDNENVNYPPTGHYWIRSYGRDPYRYMQIDDTGKPVSTVTKTGIGNVVTLTALANHKYKIQMQGQYLDAPTYSGGFLDMTASEEGVEFDTYVADPCVVGFKSGNDWNYIHPRNSGTYGLMCYWGPSQDAASGWIVEEATSVTISLNDAGDGNYYSTLCVPFDVTISGATAYTLTKSGDWLIPAEVEKNEVPAGTPVLLKGSNETATANINNTGVAFNSGSPLDCALTGTYLAKTIVGATDYVLGKKDSEVGFYHWGSNNLGANRAYLAGGGGGVKGFVLKFDEDATGLERVQDVQEVQGAIYNLAGQRLNKIQKGINIVNGKKILK